MNKFTKRKKNKLNKKIKTRKQFGGDIPITNTDTTPEKKDDDGIVGFVGELSKKYIDKSEKYITDKGLRLFGLRRITDSEQKLQTQQDNAQEPSEFTKTVVSGINETTNVLKGPVKETISGAVGELTDELKNLNKIASNPEFEAVAKVSADKIANMATLLLNAADKPIDKSIDKISEAIGKIMVSTGKNGTQVLLNLLEETPVGPAIALMRSAKNIGNTIEDVTETVKETAETVNVAVNETSDNINSAIKELDNKTNFTNGRVELDNKKADATNILKQTNESKDDFNKSKVQVAGQQTRKKWFPNKHTTTKRVRFDI